MKALSRAKLGNFFSKGPSIKYVVSKSAFSDPLDTNFWKGVNDLNLQSKSRTLQICMSFYSKLIRPDQKFPKTKHSLIFNTGYVTVNGVALLMVNGTDLLPNC